MARAADIPSLGRRGICSRRQFVSPDHLALFEERTAGIQLGVLGRELERSRRIPMQRAAGVKTIGGLVGVDVIYRRVDDAFLDPEVFNSDSVLGCRGLMRAWNAGNVALVNAPGCGVADDKLVYSYVPDFIRYYLGEVALLPNVETYRLLDEKQRSHVLSRLCRRSFARPASASRARRS